MNKLKKVWELRIDVIIFLTIAGLYSFGGGGWLVLRRYAMPLAIIIGLDRNFKTSLLAFVCLSFPLHLGYTNMMDNEIWWRISLLGLLYGLSWLPVLKRKVWLSGAILAILYPSLVWVCHNLGMDWQWVELGIGFGYAISYLIARKEN